MTIKIKWCVARETSHTSKNFTTIHHQLLELSA